VILIGPMGTGKSTQGGLLAERLGVRRVALDEIRFDYYKEIGWSEEAQQEIADRGGVAGVISYWKPFEVYSVGRLLEDHRNCVIDFGAGQSVYTDEAKFAKVRDLLAPYPNVMLLLPSPDPDRSIEVLRDRWTPKINGMDINRYFMTNPSNRQLAKILVYTNGKTAEETAEEVLRQIQAPCRN
jgi:shikimate kinase